MQYPVSRRQIANQLQMVHRTADGHWVQIAMPSYDKFYNTFVKVIDRPELENDPRYFPQTNAQAHLSEFYDIVKAGIAAYPLAELERRLTEADIPYAVCQTWSQLLEDPQAWGSEALTKVAFPSGQERTMVRTPVLFANTELPPYERGAYLGEQTESVLAQLGYSAEQIQAMLAAGEAVGCKRIG